MCPLAGIEHVLTSAGEVIIRYTRQKLIIYLKINGASAQVWVCDRNNV